MSNITMFLFYFIISRFSRGFKKWLNFLPEIISLKGHVILLKNAFELLLNVLHILLDLGYAVGMSFTFGIRFPYGQRAVSGHQDNYSYTWLNSCIWSQLYVGLCCITCYIILLHFLLRALRCFSAWKIQVTFFLFYVCPSNPCKYFPNYTQMLRSFIFLGDRKSVV